MENQSIPVKYVGNHTFAHGHTMGTWGNMLLERNNTSVRCAARSSTMQAIFVSICSYIQVQWKVFDFPEELYFTQHSLLTLHKQKRKKLLYNVILVLIMQERSLMNVNTVTRHLTTPVLCDHMFCRIQKTNPTPVITQLVGRPSITLALSGNS